MLVSVLMSAYNEDSRFIKESIESILNQTYSDFEFVIVGDTPEPDRERVFGIIKEYAARDSRIVFIPNEKNIGLTKSLNVGLEYCKGKYIARMDADDISVLTRLEKQILFMESHPNILASSAWIEFVDENGKKIDCISRCKPNPKQLRLDILANSVMAHPVSIFHRIIDGQQVKYDENMKYAQDYSLWVWMLQHGDMSNIQEVLLYYRRTNQQISSAYLSEQQECAALAQRKAFLELHHLPAKESFLELMADLTIRGKYNIPEQKAKTEFDGFIKNVHITYGNYNVVKYLMDIYLHFYYLHQGEHYYTFIYRFAKHNPKFLLIAECDYMWNKILSSVIGLNQGK